MHRNRSASSGHRAHGVGQAAGPTLDMSRPFTRCLCECIRNHNSRIASTRSLMPYHGVVPRVFTDFTILSPRVVNSLFHARQKTSNFDKLLQAVSPARFSRTAPPTIHELSMLLNRFNAMAIATHLYPTVPNVRFRISHACRRVIFPKVDGVPPRY